MARRNRSTRRKDPAPGWVWMLFGLTLGLVVAAGVYWRDARLPAAASNRAVAAPAAAAARKDGAAAPTAAGAVASKAAPARRAATAPATPPVASAESRFDFYEILPQFEVVVPEVETVAGGTKQRAQPVVEPGSYVLQAGSFGALTDADRLKASIALLGIESRIQRVQIDEATFHRVRIGPINDLERLNRMRKQLRDAHIDTMLMKATE